MLNSFKFYFALCLIGLQLIVPFIHAHSFGLDHFNEGALHIHADMSPQVGHSDTYAGQQAEISDLQHYVVKVASGMNVSIEDAKLLMPLLGIALGLSFALLLMPQHVFVSNTDKPHFPKRLSYASPNPRAPPR